MGRVRAEVLMRLLLPFRLCRLRLVWMMDRPVEIYLLGQ